MILSELIAAVYVETKRPDLVSETLQAVQESTNTIHSYQGFYKDLTEALIVFDDPTQYIQVLDTYGLPRYRSVSYIRKASSQMASVQQYGLPWPNNYTYPPTSFNFLKRVDLGDMLDDYGYEKTDVWYQAGKQVNIKSSTALGQILCGYYQNPLLGSTDETFESWIADEQPWVIIYRAAGVVFSKTGDTDNFAIYMKPPSRPNDLETGGLYWQQLDILVQNNIRPGD